ncbi:hypothetical protein D3C71_24500 [compost metagenome]
MNKQDILKRIFPQPTATFDGRGGSEVNGLPKNTAPQNCEILMSGLADTKLLGRQEHYLVRVDDALVYTRVCAAGKGSGYDEYAVIHGVAFSEEEKKPLTEWASRFINSSNCVRK